MDVALLALLAAHVQLADPPFDYGFCSLKSCLQEIALNFLVDLAFVDLIVEVLGVALLEALVLFVPISERLSVRLERRIDIFSCSEGIETVVIDLVNALQPSGGGLCLLDRDISDVGLNAFEQVCFMELSTVN